MSTLIKLPLRLRARAVSVSIADVCRRVVARIHIGLALTIVFSVASGTFAAGQAADFTGALTTLTLSPVLASGIAVDATSDIYVCDDNAHQVVKETYSFGAYTASVVPVTGLLNPVAVAVDLSGDVYVVDSEANTVYKETLSGTTYTQSTVGSGLNEPSGVAVDVNYDVYIADYGNSRVLKESWGGARTRRYTQTVIASDPFSTNFFPYGIAVDGNLNVYYTRGTGVGAVYKLTPSGSSYSTSVVASGLESPEAVAVDADGNVFISDNFGNALYKAVPETLSYALTTIDSELDLPQGVAVDLSGNIYIGDFLAGDTSTNHVLEILPSGYAGAANVGSTSTVVAHTIFNFGEQTTLGSIAVLTQGAVGLDFANAGTGSCKAGTTYALGKTCTVDVSFTPTLPGYRYGGPQLSVTGEILAEGYVLGVGGGPELAFLPGTQSTIGSGFSAPKGVAVDGSGNVYIGDPSIAGVFKETAAGSTYSQLPFGTQMDAPGAVAIDGAGNLYVADFTANVINEESLLGSTVFETQVISGLNAPTGLAVDGSGNLYIVNSGTKQVFKETLADGIYTQSIIGSGFVTPYGVAVDALGNVFISDPGVPAVYMETLSEGAYTQSTLPGTFQTPEGLAVDSFDDVFVADAGLKQVEEDQYDGAYSPLGPITVTGLTGPSAVAVDGAGNVYVADAGGDQIVKVDYAIPPALSFATPTAVGTTDTADPQPWVIVQNIGNEDLTFPVPSSGFDPSISASFALFPGAVPACPLVAAGSSPGTLAAGAFCELQVIFTPTEGGSIAGSIVLTDNNLNAVSPAYATQTVQLSGTGKASPAVLTAPTPGSVLTGSAVNFSWTAGTGNSQYALTLGTTGVGSSDVYSSGDITPTSAAVTNIPTFGQKIYATLSSYSNGIWQSNNYTYTESGAPVAAQLLSPVPGSQFGSASITFTWSAGGGITNYWLNLGTASSGANAKNILSTGSVTVLTKTVTGLPTNGEAIYATLYSQISGAWQPTVYTFYATGPAVLSSPAAGSKLGASATFDWTPGSGITNYWLDVGTAASGADAKNVYNSGSTTALTAGVTGIPQYGEAIYATLYSYVAGTWQPIVYAYTASGSPVAAALTTPTPSSKLASSSVTFTWSAGEGVTDYWLNLGTADAGADAKNLYSGSSTTLTSVNVTGLPTNGEAIFATLYSYIAGAWQPTVYTYTASGSPTPAALTSPVPSTTLTSSTVTFTWSAGSGVAHYWFDLGTGSSGAAAKNIYSGSSTTATSVNVTGLPTNGETIYATLYSYIGGVWQPTVYSYKAQ